MWTHILVFTQIRIPIYLEGPHLLRISGEYNVAINCGVEIDNNCVWKDVTLFYILNVFPALCKYVGNVRAYTVDNIVDYIVDNIVDYMVDNIVDNIDYRSTDGWFCLYPTMLAVDGGDL